MNIASSSNSKHRKCDDDEGDEDKDVCNRQDIISRIPEAILVHILSFMTTKEAVITSILSKQWRYLWTSVPIIEIDDQCLLENDEARRHCFLDFVDRVLHLNDMSCLQKLCLSCHKFYDSSRVSEWIAALTTRNVEVLDLFFSYDQHIQLPTRLFTSTKLVVLKLNEGFDLNVPRSAYLPSLKILHLHQVILDNNVSMTNLLDGCPILEELDIEIEVWPYTNFLFVRSSSLKSLKVDNKVAWCDDYNIGIVVDATNLERLDLTNDLLQQCDVSSLSSLNEVKLDLFDITSDSESIEADKLVELLRKMSKIKYMCLYIDTIQALGYARLNNLPMFHYLTRLQLHVDECSWHVISYLLECSPNLTTCSLTSSSPLRRRDRHQGFRKPKCLMLYLEEIEIQYFKGCADEMKMVRYFLKNATVLKKMSFLHARFTNVEILKKLLTFSRSSTASEIAINFN